MPSLASRVLLAGCVLGLLTGCGASAAAGHGPQPLIVTSTPAPTVVLPVGHGDAPPDEQDNDGGKYPATPSAADQRTANAVAAWVRPALQHLAASGRTDPKTVAATLAHLGYSAKIASVRANDVAPGATSAPSGSVFGIKIRGACVEGGITGKRVDVQVTGPIAEWNCTPPGDTH